MEPRITTSELAYYVQRQYGTDPYDFAFTFFQNWLHADPDVFLHENRIQEEDFRDRANPKCDKENPNRIDEKAWRTDSRPDLFLTIDTPNGDPIIHPPGAMEAQEWVLRRRSIFNILRKVGGPEDKLGKIYEAKLSECQALLKTGRERLQLGVWDHEVYPLIAEILHKDDFSHEQWMTFHRVTMTQGLAIRYCLKIYGEVPGKVRRDFKRQYAVKPKQGRRIGGDSLTEVYTSCLETLILAGLHQIRKGGLSEAATQIVDVWELPVGPFAVRKEIKEKYEELMKDEINIPQT